MLRRKAGPGSAVSAVIADVNSQLEKKRLSEALQFTGANYGAIVVEKKKTGACQLSLTGKCDQLQLPVFGTFFVSSKTPTQNQKKQFY